MEKAYQRKLAKARRLIDGFTLTTVKASNALRAEGKFLDSEVLTDLALKLQELEYMAALAEIKVQ